MSTTTDPIVDVGMPAYRRPHFIGEAIEAVLSQTYTNWRLFVSENGPGGGEVEAAVQPYLSDPRIVFSPTGENIGAAANWTRVVTAGSAPYFTLIQDDDKWDPDFLARRVAFLERNRSCGFVWSGERKMDQNGREIAVERTRSLPARDVADVLAEGVYAPREFVHAMYHNKIGGIHTPAICSVGVMSRRSALESVGAYFDGNYPYLYWDVELYMRMALRFPTGFLAIRDVTQRIHHPSLTSESDFDGEHWISYHHYHSAWFQRALPGLKLPREFDQIFAEAYIMAALDALERDDRRKCATYLRKAIRRDPAALLNPRVSLAAAGMLAHASHVLARARAARRRRSERLAFKSASEKP